MESKDKLAIIKILANTIKAKRRINARELRQIANLLDIEPTACDDEAAADDIVYCTLAQIGRKGRPIQSSNGINIICGGYDAARASEAISDLFEYVSFGTSPKQSQIAYFAYALITHNVINGNADSTAIERYLKSVCPPDLQPKWADKKFCDTLNKLRNGQFAKKFETTKEYYFNLFAEAYNGLNDDNN
jgi:hypothetical protein